MSDENSLPPNVTVSDEPMQVTIQPSAQGIATFVAAIATVLRCIDEAQPKTLPSEIFLEILQKYVDELLSEHPNLSGEVRDEFLCYCSQLEETIMNFDQQS